MAASVKATAEERANSERSRMGNMFKQVNPLWTVLSLMCFVMLEGQDAALSQPQQRGPSVDFPRSHERATSFSALEWQDAVCKQLQRGERDADVCTLRVLSIGVPARCVLAGKRIGMATRSASTKEGARQEARWNGNCHCPRTLQKVCQLHWNGKIRRLAKCK